MNNKIHPDNIEMESDPWMSINEIVPEGKSPYRQGRFIYDPVGGVRFSMTHPKNWNVDWETAQPIERVTHFTDPIPLPEPPK